MHFDSVLRLADTAGTGSTASSSTNWVLQVIVPLATPFLAFAGVWFQGRRQNVRRFKPVKQAIDLYNLLPDAGKSRGKLIEHIDQLVDVYVLSKVSHRRDWSGAIFATIFLFSGAWCIYLAVTYGGWWDTFWALAAVLLLIGFVGLGNSLPKKDRDEQGTSLETSPGNGSTTFAPDESGKQSAEAERQNATQKLAK